MDALLEQNGYFARKEKAGNSELFVVISQMISWVSQVTLAMVVRISVFIE